MCVLDTEPAAAAADRYIPPVDRPTTGAMRTGLGAAAHLSFPEAMAAWTSAALVYGKEGPTDVFAQFGPGVQRTIRTAG
ncbi:MAG: hypothetical protein ACR2KK_13290 [Acidimicrobiales bacterium]